MGRGEHQRASSRGVLFGPRRSPSAQGRKAPNPEGAQALVAACKQLTAEQIERLRQDFYAAGARSSEMNARRDEALAAAESCGSTNRTWKAAGRAAQETAGRAGLPDSSAAAAGVAASEAAVAVLARDYLSSEQFQVLTRPWVSVMGETWNDAS